MRKKEFEGHVVEIVWGSWVESYVKVHLKCDKCGYIQDDSWIERTFYEGMSGNAPRGTGSFTCIKCFHKQEYEMNPDLWL